ncbi:hypothetical protein [Massilia sp. CF038]|uniref:hypothetical protein n=1 Tax=Massilia sp. CF038 TaxID=1881045 RepID=UPI001161205E|nr:hypothetical protein [Massilia sp. CF038]
MAEQHPYAPPRADMLDTGAAGQAGPTARLFTPCVLLLAASWFGWWGLSYDLPMWTACAAGLLLLAAGLVLRARWAKYILYLLTAGVSLLLARVIVSAALDGALDGSALEGYLSLLPALLLMLVCAGCAFSTRRTFA